MKKRSDFCTEYFPVIRIRADDEGTIAEDKIYSFRAILHDTMPVLYYFRPHSFKIEDMNISIDKYGATKVSEDGAKIHVAVSVEKSLLMDTLSEIFAKSLR